MSVGQEHDSGCGRSGSHPSQQAFAIHPQRVSGCGAAFSRAARVAKHLRYGEGRRQTHLPQRQGSGNHHAALRRHHRQRSYAQIVRLYHRCGHYPQHERERHPRGVPFHRRTGDHAGAAHRGADAAVRRRGWRHHHRSACGRAGHGGGDAGRGRRGHQRAGTGGNHRNDHVDGGHPRHRHGHGG